MDTIFKIVVGVAIAITLVVFVGYPSLLFLQYEYAYHFGNKELAEKKAEALRKFYETPKNERGLNKFSFIRY